uniref:HDC09867 n=1 Tax=Drosophila melanogaster TaxID=7227 RepID=Q6ILB2_DROME|nr:TPA_inf: HDC09867 [Drosophila melanogaster]
MYRPVASHPRAPSPAPPPYRLWHSFTVLPRNPLAGSVRRGEKAKRQEPRAEHRQTVTMRLLCTERPGSLSVNHGHATPCHLRARPLPGFQSRRDS